jgi:hypothetical protein
MGFMSETTWGFTIGQWIAILGILLIIVTIILGIWWEFTINQWINIAILIITILGFLCAIWWNSRKEKNNKEETKKKIVKHQKQISKGNIGDSIFTGDRSKVYIDKSIKNSNEEKNKKMKFQLERLESERDMYTDIAYSNTSNWLTIDVGINKSKNDEFWKVWNRFISYIEKVDPEIIDDYRFVVKKSNSGYKKSERSEIWSKYQKIRDFSEKRAKELGEKIRDMEL